MKNHFAKMCRSWDQESQRRTQKPVKSASKKPRRSIHQIEEAETANTDDEVYCKYSVIDTSRSKYMIEPQPSEVYLDIQIGGKITRAKFLVIDDAPSSLLSGKTCEERKTEMPNFYGMLSKFADFCCFHRHIENEATTMQRNRGAHTACGRLTSHAHINSQNGRPQLTFKIVLVLTCL